MRLLFILSAMFVLALAKPAKPLQDVIADADANLPVATTAATKTPATGIQNRAWFVEMVDGLPSK